MTNHVEGANPRRVALKVLNAVEIDGAYANLALDTAFAEEKFLSARDRGLVTAIVYGTIGKKCLLDWYLEPFVKTAKPWVRNLLRLTLYQIQCMDRVPASAAVDEAVKLAKRESGQQVANFVNAILRNFQRSERKRELPKDWETLYSMPKVILDILVKQFGGKRTQAILESLDSPASASVRVVSHRADVLSDLPDFRPSEIASSALIAPSGNPVSSASFKNGWLTVQDETSQLVAPILMSDSEGDEEVLDACAAPGGKTTHIAQYLTTGHVTAFDIYEHKLELIRENAERLHLSDKIVTQKADAATFKSEKQFDRILVDAPCTGLGLMRRKPDIKYGKKLSDFEDLQKIQLAILNNLARQLKAGGVLVYSTCTLAYQEDFEVVEKFLAEQPDFEQELLSSEKSDLVTDGCIFITPEMYHSDGFFIAKFKKKNLHK